MLFRVLVVIVTAALLTACGQSSETTQWRFALEEVQGSVQDAYAQQFKKIIEKKTGGKVRVSIYPYGALGTSAQLTEQVQSGAVQFAFASPGHLGSVIPETQVFSLHFLFSDDEARNHRILSSDERLYGLLGEAYRERGLELLAMVSEGWMVWTGNRPLRTPQDFAGFKIRTMVSPLLIDAYKAYGASPTPMPYGEVYGALQLKMIDGQVNPVFAIEEMSFYEVQKSMTFANHLPFVSTVVTNPAFFDSLTPELQRTIRETKAELDDYIFEVQQRLNAERMKKIEAASEIQTVRLDASQRAAFRALSMPVRESFVEMAGERGKAILHAIEEARSAAAP